jgi:hypothetical protein
MDPNQKLTGIASMMPQGGPPMGPPPGMGGPPPMPQPGMGGPPPGMGGGEPPMPMGGGEPSMDPMMGGGEPPMNVEQDAMMLAEAVVGRTQGDINAAVDVLDTAKAMLMSSGGSQEPQMMNMGGPLYKKGGGYVDYKMGGGPLYAAEGKELSDLDIMRQMIMDELNQGQSGRGMSDQDIANMLSTMGIESGALGSATNPAVVPKLYRQLTGEDVPASFYETQQGRRTAKEFLKDFALDTNPLTYPLRQKGRQISRREELGNLFRQELAARDAVSEEFPPSAYMDIITRGGRPLSPEIAEMLAEMGIESGKLGSKTNPSIMDELEKMRRKTKMVPMKADGGPLMSDAQKYREAILESKRI